jgi:hypothetical protein
MINEKLKELPFDLYTRSLLTSKMVKLFLKEYHKLEKK